MMFCWDLGRSLLRPSQPRTEPGSAFRHLAQAGGVPSKTITTAACHGSDPPASGGPGRTIGLDWAIGGLAADFSGDCRRDRFFGFGPEVHAATRAVTAEAVTDVEVLLKVVAKREVQERPPAGSQLHRGRQAALDD